MTQLLPVHSVVVAVDSAAAVAIESESQEEVVGMYRMAVRTLMVGSEEDHVRGHWRLN